MRNNLKRIREALGYTIEGMAEYVGVPRPTYHAIELGYRQPLYSTAKQISEKLGVIFDPEELFKNE